MKKYIVIVLLSFLVLSGATWYAGWRVSSVALSLLGITALLILLVLGFLVTARLKRPSSRLNASGTSEKVSEQAKPTPTPVRDNHSASHGSSGGHGGGHGGGILGTLVSLAFLGLLGFGAYLFYQELRNLPPKTMHPIQVAGSRSDVIRARETLSCALNAPTEATSVPKSDEYSAPMSIPRGHGLCTVPATNSGHIQFLCHHESGGSWNTDCDTYDAVRLKADRDIKAWTIQV